MGGAVDQDGKPAHAAADGGTATRPAAVTSLELFFDLVFVFTITQLTGVLSHRPTWGGLLRVGLLLAVIFWMYGGYAWLTNAVAVDRLGRRLTLLGGMAGFLIVALAVPGAFAGRGTAFGLAYLAVVLIHLGMFTRAAQTSIVRAIVRLAPYNLGLAAAVLVGGALGGTAQYVLWTIAVVAVWASPHLRDQSGFVIEVGHFVERHGLVVLVTIGESIVAVGIGASGPRLAGATVVACVLGLALSAGLWWSHFGADEDEEAEAAMARATAARRPTLAIDAYGYCHLVILLGIIVIASALKPATAHPFDALTLAEATALGGGTALFLLGEALFRGFLALRDARGRGACALLALATIPLGRSVTATAQVAVLVLLLAAMLVLEQRGRTGARPTASAG